MDEKFLLFLNAVPTEQQGFVLELDKYLTEKGCKREIKSAKSGFVTSYKGLNDKTLLNYVFRKTGVKMRIYASKIAEYDTILNDFPAKMKKEIIKASVCKKLIGENCSPTCPGGYAFKMDGEEHKKCRSMAFFHDLTGESEAYLLKLIKAELGEN